MIRINELSAFTILLGNRNENMTSIAIIFQYEHSKSNNMKYNTKQVVDNKVKIHNNSMQKNLENITDDFNSHMNIMHQSNKIYKNMEEKKTSTQEIIQ